MYILKLKALWDAVPQNMTLPYKWFRGSFFLLCCLKAISRKQQWFGEPCLKHSSLCKLCAQMLSLIFLRYLCFCQSHFLYLSVHYFYSHLLKLFWWPNSFIINLHICVEDIVDYFDTLTPNIHVCIKTCRDLKYKHVQELLHH